MLCRETPHRLPGSCLAGSPRPVPPGPISLLLWVLSCWEALVGRTCLAALPSPSTHTGCSSAHLRGGGHLCIPHPTPWPVLVCRVSLPTLATLPPQHALPGQLIQARPYPKAEGVCPSGTLEGSRETPRGRGQESPRWERSGPHRKGGWGHKKGAVRESRRRD